MPWGRLAHDRVRGARALSGAALDGIERRVRAGLSSDPRRAAGTVVSWARALRAAQPAMGPFLEWSEELRRLGMSRDGPLLPALRRWLRARQRARHLEPERLAKTFRRNLAPGSRLLTISRSSSLADGLRSLPKPGRPRSVLVLVSEPGGEGRRFAADLRRSRIDVEVVPDAALRSAVHRVDLVVVGADAIGPDGELVHKVGTRRLAEAARRARRPFVVVAGRSKHLRLAKLPRQLPARFDRTPRNLISEYWTDRGAVRGGRRLGRGR